MAVEGSINENSGLIKKSDLETHHSSFYSRNVIVAGNLIVKHPLMDQVMIILGFVIDDESLNQDDFIIKGLMISYKYRTENRYGAYNDIVYPKMVIDRKVTHFSNFFGVDGRAKFSSKYDAEYVKKVDGVYKNGRGNNYSSDGNYNYYLFTDIISVIPECATNENVYAICKFREDGIFKHAIFSFHELIPVES